MKRLKRVMKATRYKKKKKKTGSAPIYITLFTLSLSACTSRGPDSHSYASATHTHKNMAPPEGFIPKMKGVHSSKETTARSWLFLYPINQDLIG